MKHGKKPTVAQRELLQQAGMAENSVDNIAGGGGASMLGELERRVAV